MLPGSTTSTSLNPRLGPLQLEAINLFDITYFRLAGALTVVSNADPVREFEYFAALDLQSNGRAA